MNQARHHHAMVKQAYKSRQKAAKNRLMGQSANGTEAKDDWTKPEMDSLKGKGVNK